MKYTVVGEPFPVLECELEQGESMKCESGGMAWMSDNMKMETKSGGIGKMFGKAFTGESMFTNLYTAENGTGKIAFGTGVPGHVLPIMIEPGKTIIAQKHAFFCSEAGVEFEVKFQKKLGTGIFGGEGFIMQKYSGNGMLFLEIDGFCVEKELAPGEKLLVSSGMLAAMEESVTMNIEAVKGVGNALLGGEGFFNTTLVGPGKVWLQTMPIGDLAKQIAPYIATK